MKIRRGDLVQVIQGEDTRRLTKRSPQGTVVTPRKVLQIVDGGKKLVVEGVNRVYKHVRRGHPKSQQGGRLSVEMPIDISNVLLFCNSCQKGVRVGYQLNADGSKIRICKKCKANLGEVTQAREQSSN